MMMMMMMLLLLILLLLLVPPPTSALRCMIRDRRTRLKHPKPLAQGVKRGEVTEGYFGVVSNSKLRSIAENGHISREGLRLNLELSYSV